jgi:transcriptional regulator with XRE-family HTH domain
VSELNDSVARGFGAKLLVARENAKLTQEALGHLSSVHRTEISQLELGKHIPRLDTLIKLAGALGVEPCELVADVRWTPPLTEPSGGFREI